MNSTLINDIKASLYVCLFSMSGLVAPFSWCCVFRVGDCNSRHLLIDSIEYKHNSSWKIIY